MATAAAAVGARLSEPGTAAPPAPATGAGEVRLTATGQLARMAHEPRTVHVLVTNHGPEPVRVAEVELLTGSFAPAGPVAKDVAIPAGGSRALSVGYGAARCGGEAAPRLAAATARLVLSRPATTVEVALPDQDDELTLLLHRECAAQLVTRSVAVRFTAWEAGPDGRLHGRVELTRRRGEQPVVLDDLTGNVLFQVVVEPPHPSRPAGTLAAAERSLAVPVVADANRCDGHAVGEAKQRFLLRVWISVGRESQLPVTVELDPPDQPRFEEMLAVRCGL